MSSLNSLFNRGLLGAKCKTSLNLAISRIKLLRNRREVQLLQMRKEISHFLQTGQEAIARIRVEHVIREQNILAAYEIVELFCEFVLARVPILDTQRTCPPELQEAIASIIFAAPRCSDVPELMNIRNLFATKYGKEFISAATELRPDSGVNRVIIEKLSVKAPSGDAKLGVMKGIAQEYNIEWDSSNTEAEFSKKHEDLLEGLHPTSIVTKTQTISTSSPTPMSAGITTDAKQNHGTQAPDTPSLKPVNKNTSFKNSTTGSHEINPVVNGQTEVSNYNEKPGVNQSSSDALERARAAIASADRACAAAREAAKLVNIRFSHQIGNDCQRS